MTCRSRFTVAGVAVVAAGFLPFSSAAQAADLPPIRTSEANQVAACSTPGRLMAYVRERNPKLDPRFDRVGAEYMRHGEALGVRWDYAFFQMILETGYLSYSGDVQAHQNNFAGLGATGKGARGETFPDISTGARAHIEHLVMYSGERVENPVAERTRNIQDWGVLTSWQKSFTAPITFGDLGKKWAPTSRRYASDIQTIAKRFFDGICNGPDPETGLVASAGGAAVPAAQTAAADAPTSPGIEAQRRAVEAAQAEGGAQRASLGAPAAGDNQRPTQAAADVAAVEPDTKKAEVKTAAMSPPLKIINPAPSADAATKTQPAAKQAPGTEAKATKANDVPAKAKDGAAKGPAAGSVAETSKASAKTAGNEAGSKDIEVAALQGGALKEAGKVEKKAPPASKAGACRVWTASYGGAKAIIIKAERDNTINYTVLDVNEGAEKREADAYINAYAKGGQSVGEFPSQSQALEKAFEMCPEG